VHQSITLRRPTCCHQKNCSIRTRSWAIAEGPRDALRLVNCYIQLQYIYPAILGSKSTRSSLVAIRLTWVVWYWGFWASAWSRCAVDPNMLMRQRHWRRGLQGHEWAVLADQIPRHNLQCCSTSTILTCSHTVISTSHLPLYTRRKYKSTLLSLSFVYIWTCCGVWIKLIWFDNSL